MFYGHVVLIGRWLSGREPTEEVTLLLAVALPRAIQLILNGIQHQLIGLVTALGYDSPLLPTYQ